MQATFHRVQVSALDTSSCLSGSFVEGKFEVRGTIHPTKYSEVQTIMEASAFVHDLAITELLSGALWTEYIYSLGDLPVPFAIGQEQPSDTVILISANGLLVADEEASEKFKAYLEHSPYCDEVSWTEGGIRVQLADIALPYDREVIHQMLLGLYGL